MKKRSRSILLLTTLTLAAGLAACSSHDEGGPAQRAGRKIDEGMHKLGEKMEEGGEKLQDKTD